MTTELDPVVAGLFFTCLPEVAAWCHESTLHSLSLVSEDYYRRVRENPMVKYLYEWRPHVSLLRLALSDKSLADYYEVMECQAVALHIKHTRLLRWRPNVDAQAIIDQYEVGAAGMEDVTLTLRDILLSDDWMKLDVTKLEDSDIAEMAINRKLLGSLAAERLERLCENADLTLLDYDERRAAFYGYADEYEWGDTARSITNGEFDDLLSEERMMLDVPRYEPLSVQLALGSLSVPRYNSLREYRDMLLDWWVPQACQYSGQLTKITYSSVYRLLRLGLLQDFIELTTKLGKTLVVVLPQLYLSTETSLENVTRTLIAISLQPRSAIVI